MTNRENPALPMAKQGAVFGGFLLSLVLSLANEIFDWRVIGVYDWEAVIAVVLLGSVAMSWSVWSALRR